MILPMERVAIISCRLHAKHLEGGLITILTVALLICLQEKYGDLRYNLVLVQYIWLFSLAERAGKYIIRFTMVRGVLGPHTDFGVQVLSVFFPIAPSNRIDV